MANAAHEIIWPIDPNILVRVVVLYVGQGNSAIVLAADSSTYKTMLVDINLDKKAKGIDVPRLMADLVGDIGLDIFTNTPPHDDHLCAVVELDQAVTIGEVWHSGHVPGPDDCDAFE